MDPFKGSSNAENTIWVHSNDYLNIAEHPVIQEAQISAIRAVGSGALRSGVFLGSDDPQVLLQERFADYLGYPASVLCQSGWVANIGLLQVIAGPKQRVYLDHLAHASLWEGARAVGAQVETFAHNSVADFVTKVRATGPGIAVVDSLYSTDGTICPLPEMVAAAQELGCAIVVDESHSLGTHGPGGAGLVREHGLTGEVDFVTASLSKTFIGRAGLIAGGQEFADYFRYSSWPAIFSSSLLPVDIAGLAATLDVIEAADDRRERVRVVSARVRAELHDAGIDLGGSQSQVVSLVAGDDAAALRLRDALEALGIQGSIFAPPATGKTGALVRFSLHAGLTDPQVDRLIAAAKHVSARGLLR